MSALPHDPFSYSLNCGTLGQHLNNGSFTHHGEATALKTMKLRISHTHLAQLFTLQVLAQSLLWVAGATVAEAAAAVALLAVVAPLYSRQVHALYRRAFAFVPT